MFIVIVFIVFILFSFGIFLFRNCTVPLRGCVNHNRETKIVFCWFYYFASGLNNMLSLPVWYGLFDHKTARVCGLYRAHEDGP